MLAVLCSSARNEQIWQDEAAIWQDEAAISFGTLVSVCDVRTGNAPIGTFEVIHPRGFHFFRRKSIGLQSKPEVCCCHVQ